VADLCVARATGRTTELPRLAKRKKPTPVLAAAGLLEVHGGVVMGRRPEGLLGGLWEPVLTQIAVDEDPRVGVERAFRERAAIRVDVGTKLGRITHVFTHRRLTCDVFEVDAEAPEIVPSVYTDVRVVADPDTVPLSKLALKILALRTPMMFGLAADAD